ncbi:RNA polymerase sigma-70 factor [Dinghuibacter silviterrae]|nr:RNA polymerase sigma-70 factor [Dinghuibacter silviterrae]
MASDQLVDTVSEEDFLVAEFRRGKTRAFEQLFLKHHGAICYYTREFIADTESAKDIVSDIFIKLWRLRENFENLRAIKAFLYVSAKNACLNYQRHSKLVANHKKTALLELSNEELSDIVMKQVFEAEVIREINQAIETLPVQTRKIVLLTLQGMTTEDIAAIMNLTVQTIRNTRSRATHILKKRLSDAKIALVIIALLVDAAMVC